MCVTSLLLAVLLAIPAVWLVRYLVDEKGTFMVEESMFSAKTDRKLTTPIAESVLTTEIRLEGQLHSTSSIRFDGEMTGDLSTEGDLVIHEHGKVRGSVTGRNVLVAGTIHGNVTADRLEILSTGRVFGDIVVIFLIIQEGGVFSGRSSVHAEDADATADASPEDVSPAELMTADVR